VPPAERPRIAVLGCGAVGTAFALGLAEARPRPDLTVWSRSEASVARLLRAVGRDGVRFGRPERIGIATTPGAALESADIALVCLSDAALPDFARTLARAGIRRRKPAVLVASGFVPLARLAPLARAGMALGRLHPLVPLLPGSGAALRQVPFGIEGDRRALAAARHMVRRLEGLPLVLAPTPGAAAGYHAGAALLGGGLVALLHLAEQAMAPLVRTRRADLREALLVFCEEVATNVRLEGVARALTGPVARGDAATVRGHLRALGGTEDAADAYRVLARTMRALARARGGLDPEAERALARVLAPRRRARKS
jgi:predicted short-subunit dehydrogenase-like oxidoreductase (DUF2520 family)